MKIIKLSEEQIKFIKGSINKYCDSQAGYEQACRNLKLSQEKMWQKIEKLFPYPRTNMELNWKDKEIIIDDM
jgi:hypothetical protein